MRTFYARVAAGFNERSRLTDINANSILDRWWSGDLPPLTQARIDSYIAGFKASQGSWI